MLNYDEIVTRTAAHRDLLLTNAAKERLAQSLTTAQPHPISAWMGRQRIKGSLVIPLLAILLWWFVGAQPAQAATLSVCPSGCPFTTINAAIAAASDGDTITIGAGTYAEALVFDKDLTLQGAGSADTIVTHTSAVYLITVALNHTVKLSNLALSRGHVAIINRGDLTISQSIIDNNSGPIYVIENYGNLSLVDSIVRRNDSYFTIGNLNNAVALILRSTIQNNFNWYTNIYNEQSYMQVTNSTISGNNSGMRPIINKNGYLGLVNSTVADNSGSGIVLIDGSNGIVVFANSILAGKTATSANCAFGSGLAISQGNNLSTDSSCGLNQASDKVGVDPLLAPLQNNGGSTLTHALLPGSPALDVGGCLHPTDQRGLSRPEVNHCDIGAFEHQTPVAQDDNYTLFAATTLIVDAAHGLLANDRNLDGQALTAIVTSNPPHGILSLNAQGDFQFTPAAGFFGTTSFTYQVSDGYVRSNIATVTITVEPTARLTVVLDARPEGPTNLDFSGSLGTFWLDDSWPDDGDAHPTQRTFVLAPGTYTIKRNATSGWYNTTIVCTPATGATIDLAQSRATLNLATNANVTCVFTVERGVNMNVRVFNDLVRTGTDFGVVNAGDPWLNGWLISLYLTPSNLVASRITSTNGFWWSREYEARFVNLRPGNYTVCATLPTTAWLPSSPNTIDPAYGKPCKAIFLTQHQSNNQFFGAYQATVGASAVVTPEQEVITAVDQITDLPLTADEAAPVAPVTAEQSGQANALFLPVVVAGRHSALAEDVPMSQEVLHLDADASTSDAGSAGTTDLPTAQTESQDGAGETLVLDTPLDAAPASAADEDGTQQGYALFLPLVTQ